MKVIKITFRGTRQEARDAIRAIYHGMVRGSSTDSFKRRLGGNVAAGFFTLTQNAFDKLSNTGFDPDVGRWKKLEARTLAYSRGSKEERRGRGGMPMNLKGGPGVWGSYSRPGMGELDDTQIKLWWRYYKRSLFRQIFPEDTYKTYKAELSSLKRSALKAKRKRRKGAYDEYKQQFKELQRFLRNPLAGAAKGDIDEMKARAARTAYRILKEQGYERKLDTLGSRPHRILVESGALQTSLTATRTPNAELTDYNPGDHQLYELRPESITCGSTLPYADAHHHGKGKAYMSATLRFESATGEDVSQQYDRPPRRFWPKQMPKSWLGSLGNAVAEAVIGSVHEVAQKRGGVP